MNGVGRWRDWEQADGSVLIEANAAPRAFARSVG
jgi:hypothetical protein